MRNLVFRPALSIIIITLLDAESCKLTGSSLLAGDLVVNKLSPVTFHSSANYSTPQDFTAEQIHLSWNGLAGHMTVTWSTARLDNENPLQHHTLVVWGINPSKLNRCTRGAAWKFVDGGELGLTQYIHGVTLNYVDDYDVDFNTSTLESANNAFYYHYRVGSENSLSSKIYKFRPFPRRKLEWQPHLLIVGDLGTINSRSLPEMTKQAVQQHEFDLVLHNGDFAYDMADDNGRNGDAFMRLIEPLAAYVPYQTTVGNHEYKYNFSHYTNRFGKSMPGNADGLYYTMDLGPLFFIAISTEFYFFPQLGKEQVSIQYHWLEKELKKFRKSNSKQWLVVAGHRPLYCSAWDPIGCSPWGSIIRTGTELIGVPGLEQLFRRYGVDLYVAGHEHMYERMWPMHNDKIMNGTLDKLSPYTDPMATVHVISGAGGNKGGQDLFYHRPQSSIAFRTRDYGFTRLKVYNATHLYFDQVSIEADGKAVDEVWLKKTEYLPAWLRKSVKL